MGPALTAASPSWESCCPLRSWGVAFVLVMVSGLAQTLSASAPASRVGGAAMVFVDTYLGALVLISLHHARTTGRSHSAMAADRLGST